MEEIGVFEVDILALKVHLDLLGLRLSTSKVSTKSNFKSVLKTTKTKDPGPYIKEEVMKNNH